MVPGHWEEAVPIHQKWDPEEEGRSAFFHAWGIFSPRFFFIRLLSVVV